MIAELGNFSLILALAMACIQSFFPIVGASQGNQTWMSLARPVARLQFLFVLIAFVLLVYLFLVNDFSIAYVANNSNTLLPWFYRFSAVRGAHEGSLLLWVLILNIWTIAVTFFSRRLPEYFLSRVIGVMGAISIGFFSGFLTWFFGLILIYINGLDVFAQLWMHIKLGLVVFLTIYHEYLGACLKSLKLNTNTKTSKFFRIINEVPTVLLIFIIFIVIFKPI